MTPIVYRRARVKDVETLVDYRIRFALELSGKQPVADVQRLRKQMTDYFSRATGDLSCISVIAKIGEEIAGIGSVHLREVPGNFKNPSGRWGYIMNMYTDPHHRRKGVCKGILKVLMEEGAKAGATAFELHATAEGELVYTQCDFVLHPEPTYRKFLYFADKKTPS